jgi:hypothetical protein
MDSSKNGEESVYDIKSISNYKGMFEDELDVVFISFMTIVNHFILFFSEAYTGKSALFMSQGIRMLGHIYTILYHYTKNLELTIHHSKTAIIYFTEYINQITGKDDTMFFNLSLKDAIVYVYTKTIYLVPDTLREKHVLTVLENQQMENLQEAVSIYDNMIENFVLHNEFREMSTDNKEDTLTILLKSLKNTIIAYHDNSLFITQHIIESIRESNMFMVNNHNMPFDVIHKHIISTLTHDMYEEST